MASFPVMGDALGGSGAGSTDECCCSRFLSLAETSSWLICFRIGSSWNKTMSRWDRSLASSVPPQTFLGG